MKKQMLGLYLLVAATLPLGAWAFDRIEAYGDSITAGFLSQTDATNAPGLDVMSDLISDLAMYIMTRDPRYVAQHHAPNLAWPSVLAKTITPGKILPLDNNAVSGARAWQMLSQVQRQPVRKGSAAAFFFIGHNDLCNNMDSPETIGQFFSSEVEESLREWDKMHSGSTAYIAPVGDIHRVFARMKNHVWYRGKETNYSCIDSWTKFFPYCPSHYKKEQAGTMESYMKPRLEAMNDALEKLAHSWTEASHKNRYVYLKDAQDMALEPEYFAVDCFHLSANGQSRVAERIQEVMSIVDP